MVRAVIEALICNNCGHVGPLEDFDYRDELGFILHQECPKCESRDVEDCPDNGDLHST